jgi:hypothetical protein
LRNEARLLATALSARLEAEAGKLFGYVVWDGAYERAHLAPDPAWVAENIGQYRPGAGGRGNDAPRAWYQRAPGRSASPPSA